MRWTNIVATLALGAGLSMGCAKVEKKAEAQTATDVQTMPNQRAQQPAQAAPVTPGSSISTDGTTTQVPNTVPVVIPISPAPITNPSATGGLAPGQPNGPAVPTPGVINGAAPATGPNPNIINGATPQGPNPNIINSGTTNPNQVVPGTAAPGGVPTSTTPSTLTTPGTATGPFAPGTGAAVGRPAGTPSGGTAGAHGAAGR